MRNKNTEQNGQANSLLVCSLCDPPITFSAQSRILLGQALPFRAHGA